MSQKFLTSFLRNIYASQLNGNRPVLTRYLPVTVTQLKDTSNSNQFLRLQSNFAQFSTFTPNFHHHHTFRRHLGSGGSGSGTTFSSFKSQDSGRVIEDWKLFHTMSPRLMTNKEGAHQEKKQRDGESTASTASSSTSSSSPAPQIPDQPLTRQAKLKQAVKDYGATVLVFHIGMSLCSLGMFYLLVSSGLDVVGLLAHIGIGETLLQSKATEGATTFVVAYAVHKLFAPVRITITLTATPLIVKKLRGMGILKAPKPQPPIQK